MEQSIAPAPPGLFLEWIESTNTTSENVGEYIEFTYKGGFIAATDGFDIVLQDINSPGASKILGWSRTYNTIQQSWTLNKFYAVSKNATDVNKLTLDTKDHFIYENGVLSFGTQTSNFQFCDVPEEVTFMLFRTRETTQPERGGNIKVWSFKPTRNGKPLANLQPFLHQDGRIGMWDMIGHKFYPNMGTGEFIPGPIVDDDFWELEWIESNGGALIKTGVFPSTSLGARCSFSGNISNFRYVLVLADSSPHFLMGKHSTYSIYINSVRTSFEGISSEIITQSYNYKGDGLLKCNDQSVQSPQILHYKNSEIQIIQSEKSAAFDGKIHFVEFTNNEDTTHHFIPIQKKISGEVCMYDLVTKKFFSNQGTGAFIGGPIKGGGFKLTGTLTDDTDFAEVLQTEDEVKAWIAERKTTLLEITIEDMFEGGLYKFKNLKNLFRDLKSLKKADLSGVNLTDVTDVSFMCSGCGNLEELKFDKNSHIKTDSISYMLNGCSRLTSIDFSFIEGHPIGNISYALNGCNALPVLDLSNVTFKEDANYNHAFARCTSVTEAYAKDQATCDILNASEGKPANVNFVVKPT